MCTKLPDSSEEHIPVPSKMSIICWLQSNLSSVNLQRLKMTIHSKCTKNFVMKRGLPMFSQPQISQAKYTPSFEPTLRMTSSRSTFVDHHAQTY